MTFSHSFLEREMWIKAFVVYVGLGIGFMIGWYLITTWFDPADDRECLQWSDHEPLVGKPVKTERIYNDPLATP